MDSIPPYLLQVDSLVFDVIGTCTHPFLEFLGDVIYLEAGTDWVTPVKTCLVAHASRAQSLQDVPDSEWEHFAHQWRAGFFALLKKLSEDPSLDYTPVIDVYRQTLSELLLHRNISADIWSQEVQEDLCKSWAMMGGVLL